MKQMWSKKVPSQRPYMNVNFKMHGPTIAMKIVTTAYSWYKNILGRSAINLHVAVSFPPGTVSFLPTIVFAAGPRRISEKLLEMLHSVCQLPFFAIKLFNSVTIFITVFQEI